MLTTQTKKPLQNFFFIRYSGRYVKISFGDIIYIKANKNYISIVTENKAYMVLTTLKKIGELLPADLFCRIHRAFIVSLKKMTAFDNHTVYLPGHDLPIGELYRLELTQRVRIIDGKQGHDYYPVLLAN